MLYIRKSRTPQFIKQKRNEIINTPGNMYSEITLPKDTKKLRDIFEQMPKAEIREALCKEQHGLCAYCMRRIVPEKESSDDQKARIEHYVPLSRSKELALDYQNFLGVCHGGNEDERDEQEKLITCCDAHRSNVDLTINPWDERQMEGIAYKRTGYMFVKTNIGLDAKLVKDMQKDINEILQLNGELTEDGSIGYDNTSRLLANRKRIYDSAASQLERWDKNNHLTSTYLKEKIDKLYEQFKEGNTAEPFIGVRIYVLKKRYKLLLKQER